MAITIEEVEIISPTMVRLHVSELVGGVTYRVTASPTLLSTSGSALSELYNVRECVGESGIAPIVVSAVAIDATHVDVVFSKTMVDNSILTFPTNYSVTGVSATEITSGVRDPDGLTVHLTLANPIDFGEHTLEVINAPDESYGVINPDFASADFVESHRTPYSDLVPAYLENTDLTCIEVRAIGTMLEGAWPSIALKINDVKVTEWDEIAGEDVAHTVDRRAYQHNSQTSIDLVKLEYTNHVTEDFPAQGLSYWELDPDSTAIASHHYLLFDRLRSYARLTLTAPSVGPNASQLNALIQDLGTLTVGATVAVSANIRALEGVTARIELNSGALSSAVDFAGTGDWEEVTVPSIVLTPENLDAEVRLIVKAPDEANIYVDWRDVRVNSQLVVNPEFATVLDPWFKYEIAICVPELKTDEVETYVRNTLVVPETCPTARFYHKLVFDSKRNVSTLFGGTATANIYNNEIWEWNSTTHTWAWVHPAGTLPSPRGQMAMAYDSVRERIVIFGGRDTAGNLLNELWEWDGATATWTDRTPVGTKPPARKAHAMAYDSIRRKIMMFGGLGNSGYLQDTWEWDCTTGVWTEITIPGSKPPAREKFDLVFDANLAKFYLFGGLLISGHDGEIWEYNGIAQTWTKISVFGGIAPSPRREFGLAYDSIRKRILLFGGCYGVVGAETFSDETWEFKGSTSTWTLVQPGGNPGVGNPLKRIAIAMTYDSNTQRIVMFGGWLGSTRTDETWEYDPATTLWLYFYTGYDPLNYGPNHFHTLCQRFGLLPAWSTLSVKGKFRAPVDMQVYIYLFATPWGTGAISIFAVYYGSGDWEDFDLNDITVTDTHREVELRLCTYAPTLTGTYADWKNISLDMVLNKNHAFTDQNVCIDSILIDGLEYHPEGPEVWSTGTWLPGDGEIPTPRYPSSMMLNRNGHFDFAAVNDAELLAGADTRIDTLRKGNGVVTVLNSSVEPVVGVTVEVEQLNHEFLFGCEMFLWMHTDGRGFFRTYSASEQERVVPYLERFKELFNYATLPFYMTSYYPAQHFAMMDICADWCIANNIRAKGHTLFYNITERSTLSRIANVADIKAAVLEYVYDCVEPHAGKIDIWDIANEISAWDNWWLRHASPALTKMWRAEGREILLRELFALAKSLNPSALLLINDYMINDLYAEVLEDMKVGGVPPYDVIGIQSHMHQEVWSNQKTWQVCNRFGAIHPALHFTETSILSGVPYTTGGEILRNISQSLITSWPSTELGEEQQAREVVRFYKMLFSNQFVKAITWWDLTDWNSWMGAPRGLLRTDISPKPAYTALKNLIKEEWWTSLSGITNGAGQYSFRGFAGTYRITVRRGGWVVTRDVTLPTTGDSWTIVFDE